jgi:hypothetical protein
LTSLCGWHVGTALPKPAERSRRPALPPSARR